MSEGEECDSGANNSDTTPDSCRNSCVSPRCDRVVDTGEGCDDGNNVDADGCEANCELPSCQNNIVDPGELCYAASLNLPSGLASSGITAADLNGDSFIDLAVTNNGANNISVFLSVFGAFSTGRTFAVGQVPLGIVAADLDGLSGPDLITTNLVGDNVSLLYNDGFGAFGAPQSAATQAGPFSLASGDLNSDAAPDVAVGNFGAGSVFSRP